MKPAKLALLVAAVLIALGIAISIILGGQPESSSSTIPGDGEMPLPSGYDYPHQNVGGADAYRQFEQR